jgi:hypothetical protein
MGEKYRKVCEERWIDDWQSMIGRTNPYAMRVGNESFRQETLLCQNVKITPACTTRDNVCVPYLRMEIEYAVNGGGWNIVDGRRVADTNNSPLYSLWKEIEPSLVIE